jgi:hypothetical protein
MGLWWVRGGVFFGFKSTLLVKLEGGSGTGGDGDVVGE